MNVVLLAVYALVAVAFLWRQYGAGADQTAARQAGAAMKYLLTAVALVPIVMLLVSLWNVVTPFSYRVMVDSFDNYRSPDSRGTEQSPSAVPTTRTIDENELRTEFFINGPKRWAWETLPTEFDADFPIDGKSRYTGLNVSLLEGGTLKVVCPAYCNDGTYTAKFRTGNTQEVTLHRDTEEYDVRGEDNHAGALFVRWNVRFPQRTPPTRNLHFSVTPKSGHTRIATFKLADGGEELKWGTLPASSSFNWNLYVRFADADGLTLTPSVMQQNPGAIRVGKLSASQSDNESFTLSSEKLLSEPERVFGNSIAKGDDRFLAIGAPSIEGKKVRVEVILDIVPR